MARDEHYAIARLEYTYSVLKLTKEERESGKMVTANYPAMNRRMKVGEMPKAATPIFDRYRAQLLESGTFNLHEFVDDLCIACRCSSQRATMEMISVLWHATKHPALVYYFDNVQPQPPEFTFYVSQAYGIKKYRHSSLDDLRTRYWTAFHEALCEEQVECA